MTNYLLVATSAYQVGVDAAGAAITVAAGTAINRVVWDGASPFAPPAGLSVIADDGREVYQPPAAAPTTITALAFIQRFSPSEQTTLMAANPLWAVEIAAAGTIDVTSPLLLEQLQAAVAAGALTVARMAQVCNLSVSSP